MAKDVLTDRKQVASETYTLTFSWELSSSSQISAFTEKPTILAGLGRHSEAFSPFAVVLHGWHHSPILIQLQISTQSERTSCELSDNMTPDMDDHRGLAGLQGFLSKRVV